MSSEGTRFENLVGKKEGERILPKNLLPFRPVKNSMHLILVLYLHEKSEKSQMISIMSMGQAGPHSYVMVVQYYAIRCILFS